MQLKDVVLQLSPDMGVIIIIAPLLHTAVLHISCRSLHNHVTSLQVRDRQVIAHLKAQLAQAQANRKQPSKAGGRKAQAQVHMAMEKCLHMDRQLEM